VLALMAGMIFMVKAGTLSGSLYIPAVACFATALVMAVLPPPVGILLFGCVVALSFGIPGVLYYRQKLRGRRS
jgi:serine/threonine-protein kinase